MALFGFFSEKSSFSTVQKLKLEWIQQQKIKSAYHAELRKTGRQALSLPEDETPSNKEADSAGDYPTDLEPNQNTLEPSTSSDVYSRNLDKGLRDPRSNPSHHHPASFDSPAPPSQSAQSGLSEEERERVRKLTREAYSRTSLHTFKSDPLRKRPRSGRGASNGGHERGRGQPNMRKRMGALLEQIKLKS